MGQLTAKQEHFLALLIEGKSPSEAYKGAFSCEHMSARAIATEAWKLRTRPDIAQRLREAKQEAAERAVWTRAHALERLRVVNDACLAEVAEGGADRDATSLFLSTTRELNELCDVPFELQMRREAIKAEADSDVMGLNFHPSWARVRQIIEDADGVSTDETQDDA